MRPVLYILALVADALAALLMLVVIAVGHMITSGIVVSWVFIAILILNAVAIVFGWRSGAPKPRQDAIVDTFN